MTLAKSLINTHVKDSAMSGWMGACIVSCVKVSVIIFAQSRACYGWISVPSNIVASKKLCNDCYHGLRSPLGCLLCTAVFQHRIRSCFKRETALPRKRLHYNVMPVNGTAIPVTTYRIDSGVSLQC